MNFLTVTHVTVVTLYGMIDTASSCVKIRQLEKRKWNLGRRFGVRRFGRQSWTKKNLEYRFGGGIQGADPESGLRERESWVKIRCLNLGMGNLGARWVNLKFTQ